MNRKIAFSLVSYPRFVPLVALMVGYWASLLGAQAQTASPALPSAIDGENWLCVGQTNVVYSVTPDPTATAYLWTLPTGAVGTSTSHTISVNFNAGFAGGNLCVVAQNAAGSSPVRCKSLTRLNRAPKTPGSIVQNCQGSVRTFSVALVNRATSYQWTIPSNGQILSGQGTNTITVQLASSSNNVSVVAMNCIGTSGSRSGTFSTSTFSRPNQIVGDLYGNCANTTRTFTCSNIVGATSYLWTAPTNATVVSGNGTNTVTIAFGSTFTSGSLSVVASNGCATSLPRTVSLSSIPTYPPTIQGQIDNLCGGGVYTYTATPVLGATSYNWIIPQNCTLLSQTNNSITLDIPSNFTSGTLKVRAANACGEGPSFTKFLTVLPNLSSAPNGPTTVCNSNPIATYSVVVPTGCTITWLTGVPILSQTPNSITVDLSSIGTQTVIYAYAVNACGSSAGRNTDIQVVNCAKPSEAMLSESDLLEERIALYPNPSRGRFTVSLPSSDQSVVVEIANPSGQRIRRVVVAAHTPSVEMDLSDQPQGIYFLTLTSAGKEKHLRIVKQ